MSAVATRSRRAVAAPPGRAEPRAAGGTPLLAAWLVGAACLTLAFTVQSLRDPDVWWHLAMGRLIAAHGIPHAEPFSFLAAAHPWVGQQWAYELVLARLVDGAGAGAAMLAMGALGSAALLVAALAIPRADRVGGGMRAASLLACGLVAAQVMGVRGQVITVLGSAAVLLIVVRWREGSTRAVWVLPALLLVWANLHAGFITGLALPLVAATAVAAHRRLVPDTEAAARVGPLLLATLLAAVATLVNPAGPALWTYVAQTFANPTLTQGIVEWASPDFHVQLMRLAEVETVGLVVLWALSRRPDPLDVTLAGAAVVATLQAQRNVALLAVIVLPQLARYGTLAWRARRPARRVARRPLPAAIAVAGAALVAVLSLTEAAPRLTAARTAADESSAWPRAAASYVAAHLPGQRLYSIYEWGGYLAARFPTQRVVYIYGESAVFGSARLQQYLDIHDLRPDWRERLDQIGVRAAVVPADSQETSALIELRWSPSCYDRASRALVLQAPTGPALGSIDRAAPDPTHAPAC